MLQTLKVQNKRLLKDKCILCEFGPGLEPVFIQINEIPQNAKRLIDIAQLLPEVKRRLALPQIDKSMYEMYSSWNESVEITALKFKWSQIILLVQITKTLRDQVSHQQALDSMLTKAEQGKYRKFLMFQKDTLGLLHNTVHAGEDGDEAASEVIIKIFNRSAGLREHLSVSAKDLREMGITWKENHDPEFTSTLTQVDDHNEDEDNWELLSLTSSHCGEIDSSAGDSDNAEDKGTIVHESANNADDLTVTLHSPIQEESTHQADTSDHVPNNSASEVHGGSVVVDVGDDELGASPQPTQEIDEGPKELVPAVRKQEKLGVPVAKPVVYTDAETNTALAKLPGLRASKWATDDTHSNYIDGFVAKNEIPRTAPVSPIKSEFNRKETGAVSDHKKKDRKHRVSKANHSGPGNTPHQYLSHNSHQKPGRPRKGQYTHSALQALRAKQTSQLQDPTASANTTNDWYQREEPIRQPKGPPVMGEDMAKGNGNWPENFATGTPRGVKNRPVNFDD